MHIDDLFSPAQLQAAIDAKHVRVNDHPSAPYRLYNYTEAAQYSKSWNRVTRACRGLVVHRDTGEILARPFAKFFNHNEDSRLPFSPGEPVTVTDKMDGSLGIVYPLPDGDLAVATRGSFTSEQALHATELLQAKYPDWRPVGGWTALFEIVYPANRIVLDYGDTDDLALLGEVHIESGNTIGPTDSVWPGPRAEILPFLTLKAALSAPPRKNAEGLVVHFLRSDVRVKVKQDDYVALHRIVTGWNERTIWEQLAAGKSLDLLIDGLPDEFHQWATKIASELSWKHALLTGAAREEHKKILDALPSGWARKDYALAAAKLPEFRPALFKLLDGKDINEWAWKELYPTYTEKDPKE